MHKKLYKVAPVLFLFLLAFATTVSTIVSVKTANAMGQDRLGGVSLDRYIDVNLGKSDLVYVSPEGISDLEVGEVFTVTVGIFGLAEDNLYGFDIMFTWSIEALQYVSHEVKVPVETYSDGVLHQPVVEIKNEVDMSDGTYWLVESSLLPAEAFNEDGVIFTITFVLLQPLDNPFALEYAILANNKGDLIGGNQTPEVSPLTSSSSQINEHRAIAIRKWLEWWITVTFRRS